MKNFYLSLFGVLFMLLAAQGNEVAAANGFRLDSLYSTDATGNRLSKTVNEYDSKGVLVTSYGYIYVNGVETLSNKSVSIFDDQGRHVKDETYEASGSDFVLESYVEFSEFDEEGRAKIIIEYGTSEEAPESGIQKLTKTVVQKFNGLNPEVYELYQWSGSDWTLTGTWTYEFNADGLPTKFTMVMTIMGMEMTNSGIMEYDEHGQIIRSASSTMGIETEQLYENTYDSDGNLIKQTCTTMGVSVTEFMFYSKNGATAIDSHIFATPSSSQWFDLSGRQLNAKPSGKGLFIHNGKKILVK